MDKAKNSGKLNLVVFVILIAGIVIGVLISLIITGQVNTMQGSVDLASFKTNLINQVEAEYNNFIDSQNTNTVPDYINDNIFIVSSENLSKLDKDTAAQINKVYEVVKEFNTRRAWYEEYISLASYYGQKGDSGKESELTGIANSFVSGYMKAPLLNSDVPDNMLQKIAQSDVPDNMLSLLSALKAGSK